MDDAVLVSVVKRPSDHRQQRNCCLHGRLACRQSIVQRLAIDELAGDENLAVYTPDLVDRDDIGMAQTGCRFGFKQQQRRFNGRIAGQFQCDLSPKVERSRLVSELHGRLVRPLSVLFMPILGMALGLAQRRNQRGAGLVVGVILLAIYNYTLTFGESGADKERLSPWLGLWTPMLVMFAFSIWAFWSVSSRPRDNLLTALFDSLERGVLGVAGQWRRLRGSPA